MDEETKIEKPKKNLPSVDGFVDGATKIFSIGEIPDDPVIKALKRFSSWLKYIFISELMLCFVIGGPCYGIYKIRRGEIDELTETVIQAADVFFEGTDEPPPEMNEPKEINYEEYGK